MTDSTPRSRSITYGCMWVIILVTLKLTRVIDWSWWWVPLIALTGALSELLVATLVRTRKDQPHD